MPPREETLEDLYREVGLRPAALDPRNTARRDAPRPLPRSMRPPEERMRDTRLGQAERLRAAGQVTFGPDITLGGPNFGDQGRMDYVRQLRRDPGGAAVGALGDVTGVRPLGTGLGQLAAGDVREGIINTGLGALTLGTLGAGRPALRGAGVAPPVRAAIAEAPTPPPTLSPTWERAADGSVLPVRPQSDRLFSRTAPTSADLRGAASTPPAINAPRAQPSLADLGRPGNAAPDDSGVSGRQEFSNHAGRASVETDGKRRYVRIQISGEDRARRALPFTKRRPRPSAIFYIRDNADGTTTIEYPELPREIRGRGLAVLAYRAAIADAEGRGRRFVSGPAVSPSARRVYEALERRGYHVDRLRPQELELEALGKEIPGFYGDELVDIPLFEVRSPRAQPSLADLAPPRGNAPPDPGGVFGDATGRVPPGFSDALNARRFTQQRAAAQNENTQPLDYAAAVIRQRQQNFADEWGGFGEPHEIMRHYLREGGDREAAAHLLREQIEWLRTRPTATRRTSRSYDFMQEQIAKHERALAVLENPPAVLPRPGNAPDPGGVFVNASGRPIRAYHGSPHDFDRFDASRIGTGEGAQAYGHGLYFAENEGVARSYRDALQPRTVNRTDPASVAAQRVADANGDVEIAMRILRSDAENVHEHLRPVYRAAAALLEQKTPLPQLNPGRMYEVNIHADPQEFLDWDAPLAGQPQGLRPTMTDLFNGPLAKYRSGYRDQDFTTMIDQLGDGTIESTLSQHGIPGIRYLDQGSRYKFTVRHNGGESQFNDEAAAQAFARNVGGTVERGGGTRNYVIFPGREEIIEILRKYGIGGLGVGAAAGAGAQQNAPGS